MIFEIQTINIKLEEQKLETDRNQIRKLRFSIYLQK